MGDEISFVSEISSPSPSNYMFRPLLGHHHVVLNLQSNCSIQSVCPMGDEISFVSEISSPSPSNYMFRPLLGRHHVVLNHTE